MAKEKKEKIVGEGMGKAASLMDRILKNSSIPLACKLSESQILDEDKPIPTDYPMMNVALKGKLLDGGITPGIIQFCGVSKTFKSSFMLLLASAYLKANPGSLFLFFDNEFGTRKSYFELFDIDPNSVVHLPFQSIEELKFEMVKQLDMLTIDDKVIFGIDSLGLSSSLKELNDAENMKSALDLSRPKSLKSLFRIITPKICLKKIPTIVINHIYNDISTFYPSVVIGGGQGSVLASNSIFVTTKQKLKEGENHVGYKFLLKVNKSRDVKEGTVIPFSIKWDGSMSKYSGLDVIAVDLGIIDKAKEGKRNAYQYQTISGNVLKVLEKDVDDAEEFWQTIFKETDLIYRIECMYQLGKHSKDSLNVEEDNTVVAQNLVFVDEGEED